MCANLSPFLKSSLICSQSFSIATREPISFFQKPIENFVQFVKNAREFQYIPHPKGKKELKNARGLKINTDNKKDTLAIF